MPVCTEVERRWLDAMHASEGRVLDPKAAAELETDILMETTATGKALFEKLVRALAQQRAAIAYAHELYDRVQASGFSNTGGRFSPFVVFVDRAAKEAERRFPDAEKGSQ